MPAPTATHLVEQRGATVEAKVYGSTGAWVVPIPSLGRGAADFTEAFGSTLTTDLVDAGYRVLLVEPRGFGRSSGSFDAVTMRDLAADLRAVFDDLGVRDAHLIGHAFGNRLARSFATFHPELVADVVLLAAGGGFELSDDQRTHLLTSVDTEAPAADRRAAIERAFFAPGHDPAVWLRGWNRSLAMAQGSAVASIDPEIFKAAGGKELLLLQPLDDFIAPPDLAGRALAAELGDQVTLVEIADAGHALLPEQPVAVSRAVIGFLGR